MSEHFKDNRRGAKGIRGGYSYCGEGRRRKKEVDGHEEVIRRKRLCRL